MAMLKVGDKAPEFIGVIQDGSEVKLSDYAGKSLIVYFYPKDNTPGCTAEGCSLRDNYSALQNMDYEILGVSPDSPKKHTNFINKFEFPFSLIADTDLIITKSFGAFGWKKFMGKEYEGVLRSTFLINGNGIIEAVINKVKTKTHGEQIIEIIKNQIEV
ncbi:MAG: thioredoxin-dependent thiol peroxidase [Bacteroidia bacterium]|nr:thioredoxin-dependent thiol peroxidase [Bacteroidia bacterium]